MNFFAHPRTYIVIIIIIPGLLMKNSFCFTQQVLGCRIHRLHLFRGVRLSSNECPGYDTKQSGGEASVILELWEMRSTLLLPSLPGPLWPGVVASENVLSIG